MALLEKTNQDFEGLGSKYLHHDNKDDFTIEKKEGGERRHSFVPLAPPPPQVGPIVHGQYESYGQKVPFSQQPSPRGSNSLPPGWTQDWDQATQRWRYVERSSGKTQWDQPPSSSPRPIGFLPLGHENDHHRRGSSTSGYSGSYGQSPPPPAAQFGQPINGESKEGKTNGHTGMFAGAAGGLAVGAVGGGLVGSAVHDSDSSDDEQRHQRVGVPVPYDQGQNHSHGEQHYNGSALQPEYGHSRAALLDEPASGHLVSSSHKESMHEAQEKYDQADASDKEEALGEYKKKYEEAYADD